LAGLFAGQSKQSDSADAYEQNLDKVSEGSPL